MHNRTKSDNIFSQSQNVSSTQQKFYNSYGKSTSSGSRKNKTSAIGTSAKQNVHDVSVSSSGKAASQNRPPSWFEKQIVTTKKTPGKHQQQQVMQA